VNSPILKIIFAIMNNKFYWDDLRFILAIHDTGTLSGAGRFLGLSHATVFRRLGDIERRMGVTLFDRSRTGYNPTLAGEEAAKTAQLMAGLVWDVERQIQGKDLSPAGTVRITTTDSLFVGFLSPILKQFQAVYPDIKLEISLSNDVLNLTKRETDIAIRPLLTPPEHLIGRKTISIAQAIYGHENHVPQVPELELQNLAWVGPDESMTYRELDHWMLENGYAQSVQCRVNSLVGMVAAVREGLGIAALPCYLGDMEPGLIRLGAVIPELSTDLWLLAHTDLRKNTRMRITLDYLASSIRDKRERVECA
jgi:DNA-binding transcriptional LysR family regulator